jgi:two-component system cell cycle response regulator DivK
MGDDMARILLIEDNVLNMKLAVMLLELAGFETIQAFDAEEGIRLAQEHVPQLILMDIQLPGMDGLSATRLLKNDPKTRDVKIVAMTACAMAGDREKFEAAGCDGYIAKPISVQTFSNTIRDILGA